MTEDRSGATASSDFDFDRVIERRGTDSVKWCQYEDGVLPLWVADMDFESPPAVIDSLTRRVKHGVFGYGSEPSDLRREVQARLERLYGWETETDELMFLPGVVVGFNLVPLAFSREGEGVLIQPPVYHPFYAVQGNTGRVIQEAPLVQRADGSYEVDFELFERAITPETRVFLLCNPHNPVGRVFTRQELERMAEVCLRHDLVICSDEIHEDFLFDGRTHVPIATLAPEVAARTVTLFAPSKSFNIAGFHLSLAHAGSRELRNRLEHAAMGLVPKRPGILDCVAALAAYRYGGKWLDSVVTYLQGNRDFLYDRVCRMLPGIRMFKPEGTYLAWLDCRDLDLGEPAADFFLREASVGLNDGSIFGKEAGKGFARLNFGCPRSTLAEATERMAAALEKRV